MKKFIVFLAIATMAFTIHAQNPFHGFWHPISQKLFQAKFSLTGQEVAPAPSSVWLFRPTVEISALQLLPTKEAGKIFDVSSFSSIGTGLSYQHFIEQNGLPYNDYGFNALVLFGVKPTSSIPIDISVALSVQALQYINLGFGYDIGLNKAFILAGISYSFDKP